MKKIYEEVQNCENLFNQVIDTQNNLEEKKELNDFQIKELNQYPLSLDYEREISAKDKILANAEIIKDRLNNVVNIVENGEYSVLKQLNMVIKYIQDVELNDTRLSEILEIIC